MPYPPTTSRPILGVRRVVASALFRRVVIGAILAAAVLVGLETDRGLMDRFGPLLRGLDALVLGVFVVELAVRMAAYWPRPHRFFAEAWNVFDFVIVAVCLMPMGGEWAAVLRLARVLRVLRLLSTVPRLQILVNALLHSLPSIGYVAALLGMLFYVYSVMGVFLFRDNDPVHFGSLGRAMLSLFRVVTLEDWTDVMYIQMLGSDVYPIANYASLPVQPENPAGRPLVAGVYFVSFVLIGTMIVLNLFIGVVLNSMTEAQHEQARAALAKAAERGDDPDDVDARLARLETQLDETAAAVKGLREDLRQNGPS